MGVQGDSPGQPKFLQVINSPALPSRNLISALIQSNPNQQRSGPRSPSRSIQAQIQTSRGPSSSSSSCTIPTLGVLCWQSRIPPAASSPQNPRHLPRSRGCNEGSSLMNELWRTQISCPGSLELLESWNVEPELSPAQCCAPEATDTIEPHRRAQRDKRAMQSKEHSQPQEKCLGHLETQHLQLLPCPGQAPQGD